MAGGFVHHEDPFRPDKGTRAPARRFRGRLVAPVTVCTSGSGADATGLTVASLLVAEGEPSLVIALINDLTDLYERIVASRRFVVHVASQADRVLADRFAGLRPSPGGLFVGTSVEGSPWGPVLADLPNRAFCRLVSTDDVAYQRLVRAEIEKIEVDPLEDPLAYFRGRYRDLA